MKAVTLALAISAASALQSGNPPVAGTWTAQFQGQTFVRLELREAAGAIMGTMSIGDIEVDKQGAVNKAAPAPREPKPIFDVVQRGSTVTFSRKDTTETDRFELRILDKSRAELTLLLSEADRKDLAAEAIPAPKPIALTRQ
jgi:hypothetical protein